MRRFKQNIFIVFVITVCACRSRQTPAEPATDMTIVKPASDSATNKKELSNLPASDQINTGELAPAELVEYSKTLIGIPYLFASTDPAKGFDCSGFITYVFNHFNIKIPRSSVEFTNQGEEVSIDRAEPGDLLLFTGSDSSIRVVGHMALVESRRHDTLFFIHSSSGKANGVVITPFEKYYQGRFVKAIRVFPDKYFE